MDPVIIKRERIKLEAPRTPCSKRARLLEEEGRVLAVELQCSCGELTVVRLDRPPADVEQDAAEQFPGAGEELGHGSKHSHNAGPNNQAAHADN